MSKVNSKGKLVKKTKQYIKTSLKLIIKTLDQRHTTSSHYSDPFIFNPSLPGPEQREKNN